MSSNDKNNNNDNNNNNNKINSLHALLNNYAGTGHRTNADIKNG